MAYTRTRIRPARNLPTVARKASWGIGIVAAAGLCLLSGCKDSPLGSASAPMVTGSNGTSAMRDSAPPSTLASGSSGGQKSTSSSASGSVATASGQLSGSSSGGSLLKPPSLSGSGSLLSSSGSLPSSLGSNGGGSLTLPTSSGSNPDPVPEPGMLSLLAGIGVSSTLFAFRKRRR